MTTKLLRISGFCMLACLTIYLSSCKPTEIILYGHLTGTVSDNISSDPIQGAFVELISGDQSALTDSIGYYKIRNIDPEDYYVKASADDYVENENSVRIVDAQTKSLDFSMERRGKAIFSLDSLEFGFEADSLAFYLSNTGKEQMNYSFVPSEPWISIDPDAGFLDVSDSVAVTVSIDRTDLVNSTHEEYIQISVINGNDKLDLFVNRVMDMDTNFYSVVQIGEQIWMAENLNVGTRIDLYPPYTNEVHEDWQDETNEIIEKCCFENMESNCSRYGGLYQWWEAMQWWGGTGEPSPDGPTQGVCPDGWHIPSMNEWEILAEYLGGERIAALEMTEGSPNCSNDDPSPNSSDFNALLGGWLRIVEEWTDKGKATFFWSDSKYATAFAGVFFIGCYFNYDEYDLHSLYTQQNVQHACYVRCIKDP